MQTFTPKSFNIPDLKGISTRSIEEHLKLYQGYVKNANLIGEKINEYSKDAEANSYVIGELARRFSFEYNGIRNHEVYFSSLEGGHVEISDSSPFKKAISETFGQFDTWLAKFKSTAATVRGIGWMVLWYDPKSKNLYSTWVDEQHLGQLQGCDMILGLDLWEHSYVADYQPSGKKSYIEDFFSNINWSVIEENFNKASASSS